MVDVPALVPTSAPPLATDSDAAFDAKAFPWAASLDPFGASVSAIAVSAQQNADNALAAAIGGDLPPLTGKALQYLRVSAGETAAEFSAIPTQATAVWEAGTDTNESLVSAAKVAAAIDALAPDNSIGSGQTWQDVSGSRADDTVYQNTTGKSIMVCISSQSDVSLVPVFRVSSDNVSFLTVGGFRSDVGDESTVSAIIPNQHYYKYERSSGATFSRWTELR